MDVSCYYKTLNLGQWYFEMHPCETLRSMQKQEVYFPVHLDLHFVPQGEV